MAAKEAGKRKIKYIFRWKDDSAEVRPSKAATPKEVWTWAFRNLRGVTEGASAARRRLRQYGEVIEVQP